MSDMYFKSLPDKSTPLIPTNLDKLNDIKVSPTEPTTNEKVWIQKGKNLFDIDAIIQNKYLKQQTGELADTENSNTSDYIPVVGGKTYILSVKYDTLKLSTMREIIYFNNDKSYRSYQQYDSNNKTIIIKPDYDGYIRFDYDKNCYDIQMEQGSTATEYEAYIDKKIWCKNDNGVWEEFGNVDAIKKHIIFEGYLKGGESVTLSNVKRFIDVYFYINIGNVGFGCNKYTIDTKLGTKVFSGTVIPAFDESSGLDYYISESSFDKSTNTFTHTRTGYFKLSNQSYTDKNNSSIYIVHKIETYD